MAHDPFRPSETNLDQDSALAMVRDATDGADDGELFLERRRSAVLSFADGRIRTPCYDPPAARLLTSYMYARF